MKVSFFCCRTTERILTILGEEKEILTIIVQTAEITSFQRRRKGNMLVVCFQISLLHKYQHSEMKMVIP